MKNFIISTTLLLFASLTGQAQDCSAASVPYTLDFESATPPSIPECTIISTGQSGGNWATRIAPGNGFTTNALAYNAISTAADAWFFTKGIQLEAGSHYKISYKYGNDGSTTESLTSYLVTSTDSNNAGGSLASHPEITGGTPVSFVFGNAISVPVSGVYYLAFHATSAASQGSLFVDDISIKPWTCDEPTAITAGAITSTSATITWTAPAESLPIGYFYAINTTGTTPDDFTMVPSTTLNLTELLPATTYYFFIKGFCGAVIGDWAAPVVFTTPACNTVATVPYLQDFESATVPGIPACNIAHAGQTGGNWATQAAPGSGFTSNALAYTATNDAADAWFFTQGVQLEAGSYYKISYTYGNSGTTTEGLTTYLVTSPGSHAAVNPLATHPEITGGAPVNFVFGNAISVATSGVYYLAFRATSAATQGSLFVDNISIAPWTCDVPTAINAGEVTQTSAIITWTAPADSLPLGYFYAVSTTNTPPADFIMSPTATVTLNDLEPGTTYYFFIKSFCGAVMGDWAEALPFTTETAAGINGHEFSTLRVYPNPAKTILNISNATAIDSADLYTISGQKVISQTLPGNTTGINIERLSAGIYFLSLNSNGATRTVKIIKE
jgi:hypothetical protein